MRLYATIGASVFLIVLRLMSTDVAGHDSNPPRVFLLDGPHMLSVRQQIQRGDSQFAPAIERLKRDARKALDDGPYSVVYKDALPPSGDKHDYMSLAPYWWPNPDTADGLPYIRRDGERNPETREIRDRHDLGEMTDAVETLAIAYYFTGNEEFARHARMLIRTWFIEPQTRMNPSFQFAQAIRGINTGRGIGLIESRLFTKVVDAVGLLEESDAWDQTDQHALEQWFADFLQWMRDSEHGRDEADERNNHGTYYDVQVATFALFLDKRELAAQVLEAAKAKRIAVQIEPDGRQPLELVRTKAWGYSIANLTGLMSLARLGEHVGVDLWHYQTADGRSIRAALGYLVPFRSNAKGWPYQQIDGFDAEAIDPLLQRAVAEFQNDERWRQMKLLSIPNTDRRALLQRHLDRRP